MLLPRVCFGAVFGLAALVLAPPAWAGCWGCGYGYPECGDCAYGPVVAPVVSYPVPSYLVDQGPDFLVPPIPYTAPRFEYAVPHYPYVGRYYGSWGCGRCGPSCC